MGNGHSGLDDIHSVLENSRIAIYGAGFVAMKFYDLIAKKGLSENIECFITSKKENGRDEIHGIRIQSVNEFENRDDMVVCVAVHEINRSEIESILDSKKIVNYIWIYPYLYELALGKPVKRGIRIPVNAIVQQCRNYRIAVRYLAAEHYFGKNSCGFDIYKKAQELSCGRISAEKRLDRFCDLINSWMKDGYQPDSKILVGENYELIDGIHRVTLAKYFKLKDIVCDVFENAEYYSKWIGSDALLTKNKILEAGFTKKEIEMIEEAYLRIREAGF